jgi:hypothetical protein
MDNSETTTSQGLTYPPKVDVPNLVTCPSQTLKLAWFDVAPRMDAKKKHVVKRDWIVCSKYDNHSKSLSQNNLREPK